MKQLNDGHDIPVASINNVRDRWSYSLSTRGQEDAVEFYTLFMNELMSYKNMEIVDPFLTQLLSHIPEKQSFLCFKDAFLIEFSIEYQCSICGHSEIVHDQDFIFRLPINQLTFEQSINQQLDTTVQRFCSQCNRETEHSCKTTIIHLPEFFVIQLLRFRTNEATGEIEKDETTFQFSSVLDEVLFGEKFNLMAVEYHIGSTPQCGHYISKVFNTHYCCIETYDDSRCYLNPAEKTFPLRGAYLLFYQKHSCFVRDIPKPTTQEIDIHEAKNVYLIEKTLPVNKNGKFLSEKQQSRLIEYFRTYSEFCSLSTYDAFHE